MAGLVTEVLKVCIAQCERDQIIEVNCGPQMVGEGEQCVNILSSIVARAMHTQLGCSFAK